MQSCKEEDGPVSYIRKVNEAGLFADIVSLCDSGWHELTSRSTGAAGEYMEKILGLETTNHDGPDAGLWELKFSRGTSLVTLFHKTPKPRGILRELIKEHGWVGKNGKLNFRHTMAGRSDRGFRIAHESNQVRMYHEGGAQPILHWTEEDLTNAMVAKLRRLIFVTGRVHKGQAIYEHARAFEDLRTPKLMNAIESGLIYVDFDAYLKDSGAVRDHGTKFRIKSDDLDQIYVRARDIC